LRVYRGADGGFDLYEDAGDTYAYEKGMHSVIPIRWNDVAGTLTIGARIGDFAGMAKKRRFHIVFVTENHGAGPAEPSAFDQEAEYNGEAVSVTAR
jgi:alpha-D-xyloside xylohydrolase